MNHITRRFLAFCLSSLATTCAFAAEPAQSSTTAKQTSAQATTPVMENYDKLPLSFEPNQGQTDQQVKFLSRGSGYSLFLTRNEAVLALKMRGSKTSRSAHLEPASFATRNPQPQSETVLRMRLVGANAAAQVTGLEKLPGKSNYFIGNDPSKWRTGVPNYAKVKYASVYPGIDLVYYGNQRQLEFDFVVQPGADPKAVRLGFAKQAALRLDKQGDLVVGPAGGEVTFHKPVVYQPTTNDATRAIHKGMIDGKFVLTGAHEVRFQIAAYDRSKPLVIDPTLGYSTYLGGSEDFGGGIAVDASGNAYVTGFTDSSNFPTTPGAFQTTFGGGARGFGDAFVSKLNAAGSSLLYSTYLGGSGDESGGGIAVDASGNAYVTGFTDSSNFPTTPGAFQTTFAGGFQDAFVSKLNAAGSALLYSTYLGGKGDDSGSGIALDASGNAYVTGNTDSTNFPTTPGAFQTTYAGGTQVGEGGDVFVSKLNAAGSALVFSTYLGGSDVDRGNGIAVDASGNAYVAGDTNSSNFPTTPGAFQTTFGGGNGHAFVSKLNAAGSALLYSTYLGGSGDDGGGGIAVDAPGDAYVTGLTYSSNFPTTPGAFQTTLNGFVDVFVSKLNATGSALVYSTYLGGGGGGTLSGGIAIDPSGNAYVAGTTTSTEFPLTPDAFQTFLKGGEDAFFTKLNTAGSALLYSTYLGGNDADVGVGIAVDATGNAYVSGGTFSSDFPTTPGAFQTSLSGARNAFVSKFSFGIPNVADLSITKSASPNPVAAGTSLTYTIVVHNAGPSNATGVVVTDTLPAGVKFASGPCARTTVLKCNLGGLANGVSKQLTIVVKVPADYLSSRDETTATLTNTATVSSTSTDPNPRNNTASTRTSVIAVGDLDLTMTGSPSVVHQGGIVTYTMHFNNPGPSDVIQGSILDYLPTGFTFINSSVLPCGGGVGTVLCKLGAVVPAGFSSSFQIRARVPSNFLVPGETSRNVTNEARITSQTADPDPGGPATVVTTVIP